MNDTDIEAKLREHGATWREANHDRPGIDWDQVTTRRRPYRWVPAAGVAAIAAAVVIPLVITAGGGGHHLSPAAARAGAPPVFVAIQGRNVTVFQGDSAYGIHPTGFHPAALGVSSDARSVWSAYPLTRCRTKIEALQSADVDRASQLNNYGFKPVATVPGAPVSPVAHDSSTTASMAVSPDDTELAMVVGTPTPGGVNAAAGSCAGGEAIAVVNIETGQQIQVSTPVSPVYTIGSLAWSPDSHHLAYQIGLGPNCDSFGCEPSNSRLGTYEMNLQHGLLAPTAGLRLLPVQSSADASYGPAFWWHDKLVVFDQGDLRPILGHDSLGSPVATGFPRTVYSVSGDPTGDHLLLSGSPSQQIYHYRSNRPARIQTINATSYRWDRGQLAPLQNDMTAANYYDQLGW